MVDYLFTNYNDPMNLNPAKSLLSLLFSESLEELSHSDFMIREKEMKELSPQSDEKKINEFLTNEFQEFLDKAEKRGMIDKKINIQGLDLATMLETVKSSLRENDSGKDVRKNKKLGSKLQIFIESITHLQDELQIAENEKVQQFANAIREIRDTVAGDKATIIAQNAGALANERDSIGLDTKADKRNAKKIDKKLDKLDSNDVVDSSFTKRYDKYISTINAGGQLQYYEALTGDQLTVTDNAPSMKVNWSLQKLGFLVSDMNYDAKLWRSPDKGDYMSKTGVGRLFHGQYREWKFAREFKGIPTETLAETQIWEGFQRALTQLEIRYGDKTLAANKISQNMAKFINTLIPNGQKLYGLDKIPNTDAMTPEVLFDLIGKNAGYLKIFRDHGLFHFPGDIYDVFAADGNPLETLYTKTADSVAFETDSLANLDKSYDALRKEKPQIEQMEKISNKKIDDLIQELESTTVDGDGNKLNTEQIAELKLYAQDLKNNREMYKRNFTIGGLSAMVFATQHLGYTNNAGQKVKGETKIDGLGAGIGGTFWNDAVGNFTQNISRGLGVFASDYYDAKKEVVGKNGLNVGVSLGYNANIKAGQQIGNTNYKTWNVWFGLGVGAAKWKLNNGQMSFSPYIYAAGEKIINKNKLINTLDGKSAKYLGLGVAASISGVTPALRYRQDHLAGIEITSDAVYTQMRTVFTDLFSKIDPKNIQNPDAREALVKSSLGKKFDKSKEKTLKNHMMLLVGLIQTLNTGLQGDEVLDKTVMAKLADQVAYNYSLNWYNENIADLKGAHLESLSVSFSPASMFGLADTKFTVFRNATQSDDIRSLGEAVTNINQNAGAAYLHLSTKDKAGNDVDGGKATLKDIITSQTDGKKNSFLEAMISGGVKLPKDKELMKYDEATKSILISPDTPSYMPIRIKPGFEKYLAKDENNNLVVPEDMVTGFSQIIQGNQTISILTLGFGLEEEKTGKIEPTSPWIERRGNDKLYQGNVGRKWPNIVGNLAPKAAEAYQALGSYSWETEGKIVGVKDVLNTLNPAILKEYLYQNFDAKTNILTLTQLNKPEIAFKLGEVEEGKVKTYIFTFDANQNTWNVKTQSRDKLESDKGNIQFTYTEIQKGVEKIDSKDVSFTDFETWISSEYKNVFMHLGEQQALDIKYNQKEKKYDKKGKLIPNYANPTYIAFSQAMDDNNFAEAARAANLLFAKYKDFNTFKFTADNKKELFDLCEKMIGSQLCNYDQKTWKLMTVGGKFGDYMARRDLSFIRRWNKGADTKNVSSGTVDNYRKSSLDKMFKDPANASTGLTLENYKKATENYGFDVDRTSAQGMNSLIYGFNGKDDTHDEKLVMNHEIVTGSKKAIDGNGQEDNNLRRYIFNQVRERHDAFAGSDQMVNNILNNLSEEDKKAMTPEQKTAIAQSLMKDFQSGKTESKVTINNKELTIRADYSFFFYPDCLNEGVGVQFKVESKSSVPATVVSTPAQLTDRTNELPTGFFTNVASVAQRNAITGVNFGLTAGVKIVKPVVTEPGIEGPGEVTTEPGVIELPDGTKINVSQESSITYEHNGNTINVEVVTKDSDGKALYSVVVTGNNPGAYIGSFDEIFGQGGEAVYWNTFTNINNAILDEANPITPPTNPNTPNVPGAQTFLQRFQEKPYLANNPAAWIANYLSIYQGNYIAKTGRSLPSEVLSTLEARLSTIFVALKQSSNSKK